MQSQQHPELFFQHLLVDRMGNYNPPCPEGQVPCCERESKANLHPAAPRLPLRKGPVLRQPTLAMVAEKQLRLVFGLPGVSAVQHAHLNDKMTS